MKLMLQLLFSYLGENNPSLQNHVFKALVVLYPLIDGVEVPQKL
jgi:hypothetical protein